MSKHGVRIRPQQDRVVPDNALIVLRDLAQPLPPPKYGERLEDVVPVCSKCGVQHMHQTWHLQLRRGTVIVSMDVWENMKRLFVDNGGFEFVNLVDEPPGQTMNPDKESQLIEKFVVTDINSTQWKEGGK